MPARTLGALGLVFFYQMFYGTVGYYFQYFYNRRYAKTPAGLVAGLVAGFVAGPRGRAGMRKRMRSKRTPCVGEQVGECLCGACCD